MFTRWLGLTASLLMCAYAASFVFDGKDTSLNEWMRQILTMVMAILLLFWSLIGIWSRQQVTKFTWWTYRVAIKKALECEYEAMCENKQARWRMAMNHRRRLEHRRDRERGAKARVRILR